MMKKSMAVGLMMAMGWVACAQAQQAAAPAPAAPAKTWADKITLKGDLRYRHETIEDDAKGDFTRERDRIRARLAAEAKISDEWSAAIGFSTGQNDPVSGNQTLSDGFSKKDMKLDLAYLQWKMFSSDPNELSLVAGKMKNPFINVSDLMWDGDLNPEGAALKGQVNVGMLTLLANAGSFWIMERSKESDDTTLAAGQAAVVLEPVPEFSLTLGGSYYAFDNLYDVLDWEAKNNAYGNSTKAGTVVGTTTNKAYKYEYIPVEFFAKADAFIGRFPISVYGQMVSNGEVSQNGDGLLYGVTLGKAKNAGTFEVGYRHAKLEKDAVVGAFTDSDRWGGGTDGEGDKVHVKYQFTKNVGVGVNYFMDEKPKSDASKTKDYARMQADLQVSF